MCGQSVLEETKSEVEVSDAVQHKVDRVGEHFVYTDEIEVGETVHFYYAGGSQHGYRTVFVLSVDSDGLGGLTKERDGEYRRYNDGSIEGEISVVAPWNKPAESVAPSGNTRRVRFDEAGSALLASLSGEQLAELYNQYVAVNGDGAEFDHDSGEVVVYLPEPKSSISAVSTGDFVITNKEGKTLHVILYPEYNGIGVISPTNNIGAVTPEELRDELVKFLS